VRDGPQALAELVDASIGQEQGIPARHDHVADLDVLLEVANADSSSAMGIFSGLPPCGAGCKKRQYAAAYRRHEEQRTVGITVVMFGTGELASSASESTSRVHLELLQVRHVLSPDGVAR